MNGSKHQLGNHEKRLLFQLDPSSAVLAVTWDFQSHFAAYLCKSAHFLCVTAPFPVSVEAIREITQPPPVTPFSPLVSFSIFGRARLFPPFVYLLFFLFFFVHNLHLDPHILPPRRQNKLSYNHNNNKKKKKKDFLEELICCVSLAMFCLCFFFSLQTQNPLLFLYLWKKHGNAQARNLRSAVKNLNLSNNTLTNKGSRSINKNDK